MLKTFAKTIIKSILWLIDEDHRVTHEIAMDDVKKFTHIVDVDFQSDFGRVSKAFRTVPYETWKLVTETKSLIAADKHRVIRQDGSCAWLEDLCVGDLIKTESGLEKVIECRSLGIRTHMYCLQVDTEDHLFYTDGILSHNTTCAAGFLLWKAMFTPDSTILVLANKYSAALEIMQRIRYTYENVPNHIRCGVTEYNKGNITFDNGSRILSRATTPDAGRGLSLTLLYVDEMSFIFPNIQKEFITAVLPTLSTGGAFIITSTPRSDEDQFAQIWKAANDTTDEYGNPREDGLGKNGWFAVKAIWSEHPDRNETWAAPLMESLGEARFKQENCGEFYSDEETLIHPLALARLTDKCKQPEFYVGATRWYAEPQANKAYLVALDPSVGTGSDNAAIQVFQVPEMIQVAEWSHNKTQARGQVKELIRILSFLDQELKEDKEQIGEPEIYWTFENNGIGMQIHQIVQDTGEEKFPGILVSDRKTPGSKQGIRGMRMGRNKINECAKLKSLLESDRMQLSSKNLLKELKFYVAGEGGKTFNAKPGEHDDLVSATLLIICLLNYVIKWEDRIADALRESIDDDFIEEVEPLPNLM